MFGMKPLFLSVLSGLETCHLAVEIPVGTRTTLTHAQYIFLRLMSIDFITGPCPARQNILDHGSLRLPGSSLTLGSSDIAVPKVWKTRRVPEAEERAGITGRGVLTWKGDAFGSPCSQVPKLGKIFTLPFVATFAQDASNWKFYFFKLLPRAGAYPPYPGLICWNCRQVSSLQLHLLGWQTFPLFPA